MRSGSRWVTDHGLALLVAFSLLVGTGCSSKAIVWLKDDMVVVGEITESDETSVRIKSQEDPIPRVEIEEIDHPGNVIMILGIGLLGLGTGTYVDMAVHGIIYPPQAFVLTLGFGFAGIAMTAWGATTWHQSRMAAALPEGVPVEVGPLSFRLIAVSPVLNQEQELEGLTLGFRF